MIYGTYLPHLGMHPSLKTKKKGIYMKKYVPKFALLSFIILALSLLAYYLAIGSSQIADLLNGSVSVAVRFILSSLSYPFPFSVFEALIILLPFILFLTVFLIVRRADTTEKRVRSVLSLLGAVSLIFTSYIYTLGVGYRTTPLAQRIGIEDKREIDVDDLCHVTGEVVDEINSLAQSLTFSDGETHMEYDFNEMSRRLISAYDGMNKEYDLLINYPSRAKPVYFSTVMSDLGISGIYSFFTGEANVNVEYPDYTIPYTAAHELAHQRGISRENEANFVAFLVCIHSEDEYIRYSGYLSLYEYLSSALYRADPDLYYTIRGELSDIAVADMRASNAVYNEHKDSILGKINDRLNDAYLKANGTEGVVSYSYVVRLAVSYYQNKK